MKLYKCRLIAEEYGLAVFVEKFKVLHETECYYWYSKSFIFGSAVRGIATGVQA